MINNEVMVGNMVSFLGKKYIVTPASIVEMANKNSTFIFNPLEINKKILYKFGFKKISDDTFALGDFEIVKKHNFVICKYEGIEVYVNSVHKLQNLYFALKNIPLYE